MTIRNRRISRCALAAVGLLLWGLHASRMEAQSVTLRPSRIRWIVSASALRMLRRTPHPHGLIREAFDNHRTWVVVGRVTPAFLKTWKCRRVVSFPSASGMKGRLDSLTGIWGVLYDPESWRFTPMAERLNVPSSAALAARQAHSRNLQLIVTPATDLVYSILPDRRPRNFSQAARDFVQLKLAEKIAPAADVYEIQSQAAETNQKLFTGYVSAEARQVRAANPRAMVLCGLSTNPHGVRVRSKKLLQAILATRQFVQGYWLNVPSGGPWCPTCGKAQPEVAIRLLQSLRERGML